MTDDTAVAAALAETWESCWGDFEGGGGTDAGRRAAALYALTTRALNERPDDEVGPRRAAIMALRELADGYALLSHDWSQRELDALRCATWRDLPLPKRTAEEWRLRAVGVAGWCEKLGHPLELVAPDEEIAEVEAAMCRIGEAPDETRAAELATRVVEWLEVPRELRDVVRSGIGRADLRRRRHDLRTNACDNLARIRKWVHFATWRMTLAAGVAATVAAFAAESLFVVAEADDEDDLKRVELPSDDVLAWILRQADTAEWLVSHGAELPAWVDR